MLIIQKLVRLTPPHLLEEFKKYLESNNAQLSLKLISVISKQKNAEISSDKLCKAVYGSATEKDKKNLFQLSHHTFKLSGFLSKNYPSYIHANFIELESLINNGNKEEANKLAQIILDVSEKIEDFDAQARILKFLSQQAFILENRNDTLKYINQLEAVFEKQKNLIALYSYIKHNLNYKIKNTLEKNEIEKHLSFFESFKNSDSIAVSIMARYGYCYTLSYLNDERFFSDKIINEVNELIKDQENHYYIILNFADDVLLNSEYLKLKQLLAINNQEEIHKGSYEMIHKRPVQLFWKSYVNTPLIVNLSIQASYYLTNYGFPYKHNAHDLIPDIVKAELSFLKKTCEELIQNTNSWGEGMYVRYINLCTIYASFLILGDKQEIKKAIDLLEGVLISYQQINIQKLYDALFCILIMGYFAQKEYEEVAACYKRYEKLTANTAVNKENDITIKAYYYVAQWLQNQRNQYKEKLNKTINLAIEAKLYQTEALIKELVNYFKIPISKQ
jgi:hypothetical protein